MSSKLSKIEGGNVNQPAPPFDFFKRSSIAIALTILGTFGLAIAASRWSASDNVSRRYSIVLAVTGIAVSLYLLSKGLANLFRSPENKARPDSASSPLPIESEVTALSPEQQPPQIDIAPVSIENKDQQDSASSPLPVESEVTALSPAQQPPQIYRASVSILTINGWYVGDPACCISFCPALGKITLEDGSPLPLHPSDFLIPVCINDQSCPSTRKAIYHESLELYLPYTFLKTRKEKTVYQLKYDGIPLEFSIDQTQHKNLRMQKSLRKILGLIALYVEQNRPVEPMFTESMYDRTGFYNLGTQGSIFNGVTQGSCVTLKEISSANFRPKKDPEFANGKAYIENSYCNFRCEMPTIAIEDVDIIVNETLLMIYARTKHPGTPYPLDDLSAPLIHMSTMNKQTLRAFETGETEWIFGITWTRHAELNLGLEKMKQQVLQGILHYKCSILRFAFPLVTHSSPKVLFETYTM